MAEPTTNVMTLRINGDNKLEQDPPELRVLAGSKEIVLQGDASNAQDIEVSFKQDPKTVFANVPPTKAVRVGIGKEVRLIIRQDLPIEKRGTFESHHDDDFARAIEFVFKGIDRAHHGDHVDVHIEC